MAGDLANWFRSGNVSGDCLTDLGFVGLTRDQLAARLSEITIHNGFESSTPLSNLLRQGSDEYRVAASRNLMVGSSFYQGSGTGAMASLNGPDVWLSPFRLTPGYWSSNAATLVHEAIHTFNKTDTEIQHDLWGYGPEVGAASNNITTRLRTDCFRGYTGPQ
jgi:hypothetical protein